MSGAGGIETVRVPADEVIHLFRPLRPGQIRGEPWLARALVKLNELDQYDDAELVRKKTAAMFAGFITRLSPEDNLLGEGLADGNGVALAGLEPGTLQILEPGEDIKFSAPADVGSSYAEFLRYAVPRGGGRDGHHLRDADRRSHPGELLVDPRRSAGVPPPLRSAPARRDRPSVVPADLAGLDGPGRSGRRACPCPATPDSHACVPSRASGFRKGWQWVDPQKEFNAMKLAIRAGLTSRSEAISAYGYDAEDVDREIAADNARADALGLVFDSDPRHDQAPASPATAVGPTA